jgi:hypothetical protein
LADPRFTILLVTTAVVLGLTWAVFLYAFSVVGFDQGVFEVALTTSVVLMAGIVIVGRLSFSRRARKTTA